MADWTAVFPFMKKLGEQFQSRIERLKNERDDLIKQLDNLHKVDSLENTASKKAKIITRLDKINSILINNAKD